MKTKQLFFALIISALLPMAAFATTVTDNLDYNALGLTDDNGEFELFSGVSDASAAQFAGAAEVSSGELFFSVGEAMLATTVSGGYVSSITINWSSTEAFDEVDEVTIFAKNSAYTGTEVDGAGTEIETIICDGSPSQTYNFSTNYSNFALVTMYEAHIASIVVEWTLRTEYSITKVAEHGTITGVDGAYAGDAVSLTMTRTGDYAMTGYTVYKTGTPATKVKDVSYAPATAKQTISFTMPSYDVTVEGKFVDAPSVTLVPTVEDEGGNKLTALSSMVSGTTLTYNYSAPSDYTGDVTVSSTNAGCAQVSLVKTNAYSGQLIIRVYRKGTGVRISLAFGADTKYKARTISSKATTISAQNIIMVTELNDKYYAVTRSIAGATVEAQELIKQGSNYYYKTGVDVSDITWQMEYLGSGYYISDGTNYLSIKAATVSLAASPFEWSKNASSVLITDYLTGLCYDEDFAAFTVNNQNEYKAASTISMPVREVLASNVSEATEYTRGLTDGNYATMCLPYSVSRSETFFSGVDVYRITGKYMSGDKLTGIEMEEVEDALEAGVPYVILAKASTMSVWHGSNEVVDPASALGLVGNLSVDPIFVPVGCYGIASNQLRRVAYENTAKIGQYKAYIDITDVPNASAGTPSPKRRALYVENASSSTEEEQIATSLEDLLGNMTLINWNEPVYNMLGQRVGKGTTGVLIQNGQKFIVQ